MDSMLVFSRIPGYPRLTDAYLALTLDRLRLLVEPHRGDEGEVSSMQVCDLLSQQAEGQIVERELCIEYTVYVGYLELMNTISEPSGSNLETAFSSLEEVE